MIDTLPSADVLGYIETIEDRAPELSTAERQILAWPVLSPGGELLSFGQADEIWTDRKVPSITARWSRMATEDYETGVVVVRTPWLGDRRLSLNKYARVHSDDVLVLTYTFRGNR